MQIRTLILATTLAMLGYAVPAAAIPAVQLGPGSGSWTYDDTTQTWITTDNPFELIATANTDGGNGDYAWDPAGAGDQIAYLVLSAVPQVNVDVFDVSVLNDGGALSLVASGYGAPPVTDPNSLAPHSIFDTYFEIYQFNFDGPVVTIADTQPGMTGTGPGYLETFLITINSLAAGAQIHADLFTMEGDGTLGNNDLMKAFAPFSHDATVIPEPSAVLLFGIGALVVGHALSRR